MSINDLWTEYEIEIAARQGWMLTRVFDGTTHRLQVLPLRFALPMRTAKECKRFVSGLAMQGGEVAAKALALCLRDAPLTARFPGRKARNPQKEKFS